MTSYPGSFRYSAEPAATVIRALGGVREAARRIGVSRELCSQWNRPADRRGTGGFIPPRFWTQVLRAAETARVKDVTKELLETGKKEKPDVGMMSRRKGALFEQQIVRDLKAAGFVARRVPLSGAAEGYKGDVVVEDAPTGRWVLQCKISGGGQGGRQVVVRMLRSVVMGNVLAAGTPLVAMRSEQFVALLRGEKPVAVNTPNVTIPGKQILKHLEGHDALVFRRSGSSEWMAVVTAERFNGE